MLVLEQARRDIEKLLRRAAVPAELGKREPLCGAVAADARYAAKQRVARDRPAENLMHCDNLAPDKHRQRAG